MKIPLYSFIFSLGIWGSAALSQTCDKLVISGPPVGPPSSWLHNGELIGASVDFVKKVALAAGAKSVVVKPFVSWDEALTASQKGEIDLIFSAAISTERARYLNFIEPPYSGQFVKVITLKGKEFPIRKYDDLKGPIGVAGKGETYGNSIFGAYVKTQLTLERSDSIKQSFELLMAGKVDYILAYENAASSEIFRQNIGEAISIASTYPFFAETYIALSKRSNCAGLISALSKQIDIAKKNNLYFSLHNKYQEIYYETFDSAKRLAHHGHLPH
jgi:polar amino acid transport system substrate-binding protein